MREDELDLRGEIERLRAELSEAGVALGQSGVYIERTRTENERLLGGWQDAESEIKRLLAEVERLQREGHFTHETALQMHDRQVALLEQRDQEVERLRAALAECEKNLAIWEAPDQRW